MGEGPKNIVSSEYTVSTVPKGLDVLGHVWIQCLVAAKSVALTLPSYSNPWIENCR